MKCVIRHARQDSALMRQQYPESWWKTPQAQLAALVYDAIQEGNWQRSGNPELPYPEPLLSAPKPAKPEKPKMSASDIRAAVASRRRAA
ncbi:hypothetical protein GS466_24760 [Rhodococcus hoagii]|nr:hypothetical protein [Prescottella equi]